MKKVSAVGPPLMALMFVCIGFLCAGCLEIHEYDEQSELHALQAERNETLVDNGMDDLAIEEAAEEAYRLVDPEPPGGPVADDGSEQAPSEDWLAWEAKHRAIFPGFRDVVRRWALTDLERDIRLNQADAWRAYEEAKRPPDVEPPQLE